VARNLQVGGVRYHGSYDPRSFKNDLAFIILEKSAKTKPAAMAIASFKPIPNEWLYAAGWGSTEVAGAFDHTKLMMAYIPFQTASNCAAIMKFVGSGPVPSTHICAGAVPNPAAAAADSSWPFALLTSQHTLCCRLEQHVFASSLHNNSLCYQRAGISL
jgi:secreted trypsin-like serine protease